MNKNLPQAIKLVRSLLDSEGDVAATIGHALDQAQLLADPERSYGVLLRRQPTGEWMQEHRTELEQQALAWDASCRHAADVAEVIRQQCGERSGLQRVQVQSDRLLVSVHVTSPEQWGGWCQYLGITSQGPQTLEYAYTGSGRRDGVAVAVVAYDAPQVEARTVVAARMPHRHLGIVYDLALPHQDSNRDVWDYASTRADGMPLMTMRGSSGERCSLAHVVDYVGPLSPMQGSVESAGKDTRQGESTQRLLAEQPFAAGGLDV
ncbi:BN159_2729 family protein [Streptomyces albipurpureus]|uniref:BN159_2729 family protein n=1 Tax=Streptomyces albipurpureus TaxID=2897419 RepID=A0ABT0V115_9ACTN|nr:BN159_2729 family protein [Streptomyces sp. CWNU-1]MCM2394409.1 BN159_2729 family protein [Streptomyces sp. CWNU-1]